MAQPKKPADDSQTLALLRELLDKGLVLPAHRVQETVDEAVRRGRMTRQDAEELVQSLVASSRRQTRELMAELEALVGRGTSVARKAAGVGSGFPIDGYEDLTAAQVNERLDSLSAPELRKVRDHERRNANRKSVLAAIDRRLG
jgi:hypothetical protein